MRADVAQNGPQHTDQAKAADDAGVMGRGPARPRHLPSDAACFSPETGSDHLYEFMDAIADRIALKGFAKFRGGLDVASALMSTGTPRTVQAFMCSRADGPG